MILPPMIRTPIVLLTLCLGMALFTGCGSSAPTDPADGSSTGKDTPVDLTWSQDMDTQSLLDVLLKLSLIHISEPTRPY